MNTGCVNSGAGLVVRFKLKRITTPLRKTPENYIIRVQKECVGSNTTPYATHHLNSGAVSAGQ